MVDNNIIYLGFADNKEPEFKEVRSKEWILFGEDNKFPDRLLYLYNKSSNHGAIINGKVRFIFGKGFPVKGTALSQINDRGENLNQVSRKCITDIELYGGYYLEVVWKMGGGANVYHMPFSNLRKGKEGGWWYKEDWNSYREDARYIPDIDLSNRKGAQIFAYREYRAGIKKYPLPGYFAALNDIETDVEISKYNLSVIKNGMFSSKMITFKTGDPGEEGKKKLEKGMKDKFNGSENAGNSLLVFVNKGDDAPTVEDLSTTDLDKLFDQLNKTTQAEIFTGHEITSSVLFGVKTEGGLGDRSEMETAYEIFKNTYVNNKQESFEESIIWVFSVFGIEPLKLEPVSLLGFKLSDEKMAEIMPKEWLWEQLGIDPAKYPVPGGNVSGVPMATNDHLKNMTGKQNQQMLRIIRQYGQGKLTREQAATMLRTSLAMSEEDINVMLGADEFSAEYNETDVAAMFESVGESRQQFSIVKSRPYKFSEHYDEFADIKETDSSILNLIGKDKRITAKVIAETLKLDPDYVSARISSLEKSGVLTPVKQTIGVDTIIERSVNPEKIDTRAKPETVDVYIKYSYEAKPGLKPVIETTRPFCKRLIELDRLYTRAEIESISQRVGFSVWDRKGGFWGDSPECRHNWVRHVVIKKK